jgi:hypothetical protein
MVFAPEWLLQMVAEYWPTVAQTDVKSLAFLTKNV